MSNDQPTQEQAQAVQYYEWQWEDGSRRAITVNGIGWATGHDINLPFEWIDCGKLTPLIAATPELVAALRLVNDVDATEMDSRPAREIIERVLAELDKQRA